MSGKALDSNLRWRLLLLLWVGSSALGFIQLSGAPVQLAISSEFHLSAAALATWINLPLLAVALFSIPGGVAADRLGSARLIGISLLMMGLFGMGRGWASSFLILSILTFLFGLGQALMLSAAPKLISEWFPNTELGRAVGIYSSGPAVGVLAVFLIAPYFQQQWRELFLAGGALALFTGVSWVIVTSRLTKSSPVMERGRQNDSSGIVATAGEILQHNDVILLMAVFSCLQVGLYAWLAFGFPFLVLVNNVSAGLAGAVVSLTMVGFWIGAVVFPGLSDRFPRRAPFFRLSGFLGCFLFLILPSLPAGPMIWICVPAIGLCFGTLQALVFTMPLELPGISQENVGLCEGIVISAGFLAGIVASPFLGSILGDLESAGSEQFSLIWYALAIVMLIIAGFSYWFREDSKRLAPLPR